MILERVLRNCWREDQLLAVDADGELPFGGIYSSLGLPCLH